jgi:Peptidase family M28
MSRLKSIDPVTIMIAILALSAILAGVVMIPPQSAPLDAPPTGFSGERALRYTDTMLAEDLPHYTGSDQQFLVRDRILREFELMGYEPALHDGFSHIFFERFSFAQNIVVTLPGEPGGKTIILTGHYDSVRASPTSLCDANGVGAIMEIARTLKQLGPNRHTIIFLLTDAEETGLQGAYAFRDDYPDIIANTIAVLSVDRIAPGVAAGISYRGPQSGWIESAFVANDPRPICSSSAASYTDRLPQLGGDSAVFFDLDIPGLHFGGYGRFYYHMPLENSQILEPNHLQEFGDKILGATIALANETETYDRDYKLVYGGFAGLFYFSWPESWNPLLVGIMGLLTAAMVVLMIRQSSLAPKTLLLGFALWSMMAALLAGTGFLFNTYGQTITGSRELFPANYKTLLCAVWAAPLLICLLCGFFLRRFSTRWPVVAGGAAGLVLAATALTIWLPGATYLAVAPGIGLTSTYVVALASKRNRTILGWIDVAACFVAGVLVFQMLVMVHESAGTSNFLLPVAVFAIPLTFVLPWCAGRGRQYLFWTTTTALFVAVMLFTTAASPTYHDDHPTEMNILYVQDTDSDAAWWSAPHVEERTRGFMRSLGLRDVQSIDRPYADWLSRWHFSRDSYPGFVSEAINTPVKPPKCEILAYDTRVDTVRVTMRLSSPRGADEVGLLLPPGTKRTHIEINGIKGSYSGTGADLWREYEIFAQGLGEVVVTFEFIADQPLETWIFDSDPGLPAHASELLNARPPWATKRHRGDRWMVFKRITLTEAE